MKQQTPKVDKEPIPHFCPFKRRTKVQHKLQVRCGNTNKKDKPSTATRTSMSKSNNPLPRGFYWLVSVEISSDKQLLKPRPLKLQILENTRDTPTEKKSKDETFGYGRTFFSNSPSLLFFFFFIFDHQNNLQEIGI